MSLVAKRERRFTRQLVIRVDQELFDALEADAERHGRTIAQSVRFYLRQLQDEGRLDRPEL